MFKRCKVVMLPTKNKETLIILGKNLLVNIPGNTRGTKFDLYFLSDEKIKEGDWVYENNLNQETKIYQIQRREGKLLFFRFRNVPIWLDKDSHNCKKIIATTNEDLYPIIEERYSNGEKKGVKSQIILSRPSQQFIEKYIAEYNKGNVISDVLVEYEDNGREEWSGDNYTGQPFWNENWQLKVNPKDNTITNIVYGEII